MFFGSKSGDFDQLGEEKVYGVVPPKLKHCLTIWVESLVLTSGNPIGMANIVTSDFSPLIKPKNKSKKNDKS